MIVTAKLPRWQMASSVTKLQQGHTDGLFDQLECPNLIFSSRNDTKRSYEVWKENQQMRIVLTNCGGSFITNKSFITKLTLPAVYCEPVRQLEKHLRRSYLNVVNIDAGGLGWTGVKVLPQIKRNEPLVNLDVAVKKRITKNYYISWQAPKRMFVT